MRDLLEWRKEQREIDFLGPSRGVLPISVLTHKSKQENKREIKQKKRIKIKIKKKKINKKKEEKNKGNLPKKRRNRWLN